MSYTVPLSRVAAARRGLAAWALVVTGLVALAATALDAAPCKHGREVTYEIEQFPNPPGIPGVQAGDYSAISNNARLVTAYDDDFRPLGLIERGKKHETFRVGDFSEEYTWYLGINEKGTTVGVRMRWADFTRSGWIRGKSGNVATFSDPSGDVYLYRLNNRDVAVGEVDYPDFFLPVIADRHGLTVVHPAGVDPDHPAYFTGINDAGDIVGGAFDPDTWEHTCLLWTKHRATVIAHEGATRVVPQAINNRGQVAGYWTEPDSVIGERTHGFLREPDGTFRTVDIDFPHEDTIDVGGPDPALLIDQTTMILDLNDRGEIIFQATGWYADGDFVFPAWSFGVGKPTR